jgi:hypothetical protein
MDDFRYLWPMLVPITAIVAAFVYAIVGTLARARVREMEVRERIAMIERGLVPPPEVDPRGFDRAMDVYDRHDRRYRRAPGRHRRAGVTLMGIGFGLMLLIGVAGESMSAGIGVGGFLVIMGLAFFLNSLFDGSYDPPPYSPPPPSQPPSAPPSFGGGEPRRPA